MSIKRIYCDISATTPLDPRIGELLTDLNEHIYGNPSSIHREGQAAKAVVEKSRRQIANAINAQPDEIIFTSSGSESNNMVLKGVLCSGDHFITSSYEHPAILKVLPYLEIQNIDITLIKPDHNGMIQPADIEKNINENTRLISIMWVNNELGTINPIFGIS
ncbi:MAG TPA: aminotransferase class V-fold PLP-dependent enzyme, partial [Candidatus Marinimicrobia bacterium]|nr:aminotransferase class V-fold PLP-dependent enzyme [Candidatus Neomarinimicrobiota bacterium]